MPRGMPDRQADQLLWAAVGAWILNCIQPALGMLAQFTLIIYCVWRCDVKVLPTILLCMLTRGNLGLFRSDYMALRLGFTISTGSMFAIATFFFAIIRLITGRYNLKTMTWCFVWLLAFVPASIMSFTARSNNLVGMWSYPIMDVLIPGIYFWAISAGNTYLAGKEYLFRRLLVIISIVSIFSIRRVIYIFSFFTFAMMLCMMFYVLSNKMRGRWKTWAVIGCVCGLFNFIFGRAIALQQSQGYVVEADKYGSTFSSMGTVVAAVLFAYLIGKRMASKGLFRLLPVAIVAANVAFVSFVLTTQEGDEKREVNWQAEEFDERITAKVFGDRAGVWKIGWEEVKTPPYFIKDLRSFYVFDPVVGWGMKLLPHNQFITLLAREGFWLGLTLALWIIAIWSRALVACYDADKNDPMKRVYLPVGLAVFAVVGVSGQTVVSGDPWSNALVCIIFPGIAYGDQLLREKLRLRGYWV